MRDEIQNLKKVGTATMVGTTGEGCVDNDGKRFHPNQGNPN